MGLIDGQLRPDNDTMGSAGGLERESILAIGRHEV